MSKFSRQHHNAIAKDIREQLEIEINERRRLDQIDGSPDSMMRTIARIDAIVQLALRFSTRFVADNDNFDPVVFLNACSPNDEMYPIGELWKLI